MKARPIFFALFFTTTCTVGPNYRRPNLVVPETWRHMDPNEQDSLTNKPW